MTPKHQGRDQVYADEKLLNALRYLIATWHYRARSKFRSASKAPSEDEARHIKHGATCYFNCYSDLERVLDELGPSDIPQPGRDHLNAVQADNDQDDDEQERDDG